MGRHIKASLQAERKQRADMDGADIDTLLASDPPLIEEVWLRKDGWHKEEKECDPMPIWITTNQIIAERFSL